MANASGAKTQVAYVVESVFGTTPTTPTMTMLRTTGAGINLSKQTLQSGELRSDRAIANIKHGNRQVGGEIPFELTYGTFDDLIEAVLGGTWTADVLKQGIVQRSFSIERGFVDIAEYLTFSGCTPNTLSLSMKPNAMVTGSIGVIGKDLALDTSPLDAAPTAAPTNTPMDSFSGTITEGGSAIAYLTGVDMSINNAGAANFVLGSASVDSVTLGRFNLSGTLTAYFPSAALLTKFINETSSSLVINLADVEGNTYSLSMANIKYMGGDIPVNGEGPIVQSLPFQALHDVTDTALKITRTAA